MGSIIYNMETVNIIIANFSLVVSTALVFLTSAMVIIFVFYFTCADEGRFDPHRKHMKYGWIALIILSILYILTNNVQL